MKKTIFIASFVLLSSFRNYACPIDTFILSNYYRDASFLAYYNSYNQDEQKDSIVAPKNVTLKYLKALNSIFLSGYSCVDSIFTTNNFHVIGGAFSTIKVVENASKEWVQNATSTGDYSGNSDLYQILFTLGYKIASTNSIGKDSVEIEFESNEWINVEKLVDSIKNSLSLKIDVDYRVTDKYSNITSSVNNRILTFSEQVSNDSTGADYNSFYEFTFDTACNAKLLRTHNADYTQTNTSCEIDDRILANYERDAKILALYEVGQHSLYGDSIELPSSLIKKYLLAFNSVLNSGYSCVDTLFKSNYPIHEFGNRGTILAIDIPVDESWLQNIEVGAMPEMDSPIFDFVSPYNYVITKIDTIVSTGVVRMTLKTDSLINEEALGSLISKELNYSTEILYWSTVINDGFSKPNDWNNLDTVAHTSIIMNLDLETITFERNLTDSLSNYPLEYVSYQFSFDTTCNAKLLRTHYADFTTTASQTSFPESNAIWNVNFIKATGSLGPEMLFGLKGDTLINDSVYHKLYELSDTSLDEEHLQKYIGGFWLDAQRVWFKPAYWNYHKILLYDFSVSVGDTIWHEAYSQFPLCEEFCFNPSAYIYSVVQSIEVIDGIKTYNILRGDIAMPLVWYEGIGSSLGILGSIQDFTLMGETYNLACFKHNDTVKFQNNLKCEKCFCNVKTQVIDLADAQDIQEVFPNPTSGILQVRNQDFKSYQIFDLNGKEILHGSMNTLDIDISHLQKGVYILKLGDGNGSFIPYKIVKN